VGVEDGELALVAERLVRLQPAQRLEPRETDEGRGVPVQTRNKGSTSKRPGREGGVQFARRSEVVRGKNKHPRRLGALGRFLRTWYAHIDIDL